MPVRKITPTTLTAKELAAYLREQISPLRALFNSGNHGTRTGAICVHDNTVPIIRALEAGEMDPVKAQVRLIAVNEISRRYHMRVIRAHRPA
ncbi:hypothetical protein AQJ30_15565 [Streptomyces longwoodensis]|uniref:Uncharacterized protein n=1 Tax=Streptomyces longwoodensis TaxID=68231 RepID=A0A101QXS7_9ACTN|nr:hypothetical protein [Streptomyces longwoodensis]KUN37701.1 hypothetical protein AQJ30_15565 [Streptomyces longwoodensis]